MSHIAQIELQINDLDTLKAACKRLGLEFLAEKKSYAWYGTAIGDYPLPEGIRVDELGKCDHAIHVPGASYEIGVVRKNGKWQLLWDFWRDGGLERVLGKNAGRLKQAYAVERVRNEAKRKGYHVTEQKTEEGIRLVLRV